MKRIFLLFALLASGSSVMALGKTEKNSPNALEKEMRMEIVSLLASELPVEFQLETDILTRVSFLLNDANELVLISVHTPNASVKTYLKRKLNYKTLRVKGVKKGKIFNFNFRIKAVA